MDHEPTKPMDLTYREYCFLLEASRVSLGFKANTAEYEPLVEKLRLSVEALNPITAIS